MKTILFLIFASTALLIWVVTGIIVENRQDELQGAVAINADYQRCVTIIPGPIQRPRAQLGTRRSDTV